MSLVKCTFQCFVSIIQSLFESFKGTEFASKRLDEKKLSGSSAERHVVHERRS